ncbi:putative zinc-responsive transcriptional regulator [Triangularia verruculosa]|uniref:Zinc-responsive transcriptional regulator n=1 Tax=Triangularia verruculosa TaxID=2587418 RepID=A0AAN7AW74_9PEZI|nr:putative zinc-responsive transcriptional regulator [Triangularia verruculosa]
MDGSFGHSGRFPGYGDGFHRHSQSSNDHQLSSLDFSTMAQSQLSHQTMAHIDSDTSRMNTGSVAYESHDDLCVDACMGVGLYNGFQQFNHRGAPASLAPQTRWQNNRFGNSRDNSINPQYQMDLSTLPLQQQQQQQHQFHTDLDMPNPYQQCFDQQMSSTMASRCEDEDCQSMSASMCCDSECTMTGKCTAEECETEEDACTDQSCPSRPVLHVPEEVRDGAAALLSINHAPGLSSPHNFNFQQQSMNSLGFDLGQPSQNNFLLSPSWDAVGSIANHLLVAHDDTNLQPCTTPCPLGDPSIYTQCHMPVFDNSNAFGQFNSVASNLQQMNQLNQINQRNQLDQRLQECGAQYHDPQAFAAHFFSHHKVQFTNGPMAIQGSGQMGGFQNQSIMSSRETMSPPEPALDNSDTTASMGTPSPLTPTSHNIEMTDIKHSRSLSIVSSADDDVKVEANEEHRCLWREEGSSEICGFVFDDAEALFRHASNSHIKHAQKRPGDQGFRCGWDDCPRSAPGASGFPQRSKIERHMQTHIGHKPHICPVCQKGFSAKQALTQHMFIHSNEKPLSCNLCSKTFRYPSALTMHQRVHSGAKPLTCPVCGKGFSESSNLSKHKRTHEVKGRFNCSVPGCDRNFHRQDQLRRHMKTHNSSSSSSGGGGGGGGGKEGSSGAEDGDMRSSEAPEMEVEGGREGREET